MDQGVLGTGPDGNKRKRADAQAAYISSMMQGNPKLLLSESPLFNGLTQHQLPFVVTLIGASSDIQYQAQIQLQFPVNLTFCCHRFSTFSCTTRCGIFSLHALPGVMKSVGSIGSLMLRW